MIILIDDPILKLSEEYVIEDGRGRNQQGGSSIAITTIENLILKVYNHDYIDCGS